MIVGKVVGMLVGIIVGTAVCAYICGCGRYFVLVEHDVDLRRHNTMGVAACAQYLIRVDCEATLEQALAWQAQRALPWFVLGGGSNVVLPNSFAGLVLLMAMRGVRIERAVNGDGVLVEAAAGESWHGLVRRCLGEGLSGIENLALIPGTVGAAPMQNIGAYGAELKDVFVSARVFLVDERRFVTMNRAQCEFSYRDSIFRNALRDRAVITAVTLRLSTTATIKAQYPDVQVELARLGRERSTPTDVAEAVIRVRRRKLPDPRHLGNVGSFFKNPVVSAELAEILLERTPALRASTRFDGASAKFAAAALIELAGWKGRVVGAVEVWRRQPLVLVNHGGASHDEVLAVAGLIAHDVADRFGISLAVEPRTEFPGAAGR